MGAAFLITLREGIEAALVISIILAYLRAIGRVDRSGLVWAGAGTAIAVSLVAGVILNYTVGAISETSERTAEIIEGIGSLLAVAVLTWMIFWMRRQARHIKGELQERVDLALASGSGLALAALAFFVVVREGLETVLFLFGTIQEEVVGSVALGYVGAALGLALAVLLGALILVVAAGLFAFGIHELQEVGWITVGTGTAFDIGGVLSDEGGVGALLRAMFGYNADPTVLELAGWLTYLVVTGFLFFRPDRRPATAAGSD